VLVVCERTTPASELVLFVADPTTALKNRVVPLFRPVADGEIVAEGFTTELPELTVAPPVEVVLITQEMVTGHVSALVTLKVIEFVVTVPVAVVGVAIFVVSVFWLRTTPVSEIVLLLAIDVTSVRKYAVPAIKPVALTFTV
jgi:hypothetical protein